MTDTTTPTEPDAPAPALEVVVSQQVCDRCGSVIALWDVHAPVCSGLYHAPTPDTED